MENINDCQYHSLHHSPILWCELFNAAFIRGRRLSEEIRYALLLFQYCTLLLSSWYSALSFFIELNFFQRYWVYAQRAKEELRK